MNLTEIIEKARQSRILEQEREQEANRRLTLEEAQDTIESWRREYCKASQRHNYIRITRIIPKGFEDRPYFFQCKLQAWVKGKLTQERNIENDTYHFISTLEGWDADEIKDMEYCVWRNPKIKPLHK